MNPSVRTFRTVLVNRFYKLSLVSGSINEFPLWEAIIHGFKKRLMQGTFPSERVEGNQSGIQIDFASCQPHGFFSHLQPPNSRFLQHSKQCFSHSKVFGRLWQLPTCLCRYCLSLCLVSFSPKPSVYLWSTLKNGELRSEF